MNRLPVGPDSPLLIQAAAATILVAHIAGGTVGILSGMTALAARKGGRLHALAGKTFFVSMLVMASIGALVAPFPVTARGEPKLFDSLAGGFTFYLVVTSWLTVKRKPGTTGRPELAAFLFAASLAAVAILLGISAAHSATGHGGGFGPAGYYGIGGLIAFAAALDLKVLLNGGISGSPRLARHLWRMCLALFVAAGSFFLGQQRQMPVYMRGSPLLEIPPLIPLAMMLFWLLKLRFAGLFRRLRRSAAPAAPAGAAS